MDEREREREMRERTLFIWPDEDVNISSLVVQMSLVPSLDFLSLFPEICQTLYFLHHFLPHFLPLLKLSFYDSFI